MKNIMMEIAKKLDEIFTKIGPDKYVISRGSCDHFTIIAREALYTYDTNTLLCERFFLADKCQKKTFQAETLDREALDQLIKEKFPKGKMSQKTYAYTYEKYREELKNIPKKIQDVEVTYYCPSHDPETGYVLHKYVKDTYMSKQIASYVITYFMTHQPFFSEVSILNFDISVIDAGDYIDVVATKRETQT